jgi:hypothetical protein
MDELSADLFSFKLLQKITKTYYNINEFIEAHDIKMFLLLMDMLARIENKDSYDTPSSKERFINIYENIYQRKDPIGFNGKKIINQFQR